MYRCGLQIKQISKLYYYRQKLQDFQYEVVKFLSYSPVFLQIPSHFAGMRAVFMPKGSDISCTPPDFAIY